MREIPTQPSNFIRQIVVHDLANGHCQRVQTRFPPEPNGYLHLGHAKALYLNFSIAQDYKGSCYLRFDDTDPQKEERIYIEAIQRDIRWLGFEWDGRVRYTSDYFPQLYQFAVDLIQRGLAYVETLSPEEIRFYRGSLTTPGRNSPYRDRPVEENLSLFQQMRRGQFAVGAACLRARIDMASPYMVLRDPVLYRVKSAMHHQTGTAWPIYPMYDFAHPICDALEGITHSLCTLEFQDNRRLYDWVLDHITLPLATRPRQYEFSRLNLAYLPLSKRKLQQLITMGVVTGWDDPRMPTLAGLRRRGYSATAIQNFCRRIGVTKQEHLIELSLLEACIREDLNQRAPRTMAVLRPLKVVIENFAYQDPIQLSLPNHPEQSSMGCRQVTFGHQFYIDRTDFREQADKNYKRLVLGKSVRLRHAYVITAHRVEKDSRGEITTVYCTYDPQTLGRNPVEGKVRGVIHWVDVATALPAEFRLYDRLFKEVDLEKVAALSDAINPDSLKIWHGFVESSVQNAQPEQVYQFEREGYFCLDSACATAMPLIFNRTVALREQASKTVLSNTDL